MSPGLLLGLGVVAVLCELNAWRPRNRMPLLLLSWPLAWLTVELAAHLSVTFLLLGAALVVAGALAEPAGWVGLTLLLTAVIVAVPLILQARRTVVDLDPAPPGELSEPEARYPRSHQALPLLAWLRRDIRRIRGVEFAKHGGVRLKLDVFLPRGPVEGRRPAIVHVHGGGWVVGSRREQGVPLLGHLAANGWVGFNVDYRLSPRATWPEHAVDVKRAVAWVREHADEYGVDPEFVAITGGSAGGHLSAFVALTSQDTSLQPGFEEADTSVAACVPFYGVYDLADPETIRAPVLHSVLQRAVLKVARDQDPEAFRRASPAHRIVADAPPFLVVHGDADSLIPTAEATGFVARLREVSTQPVYYAEMRGGQHAFDVVPSWRTVPLIDAVRSFLVDVHRQHLERRTSRTS